SPSGSAGSPGEHLLPDRREHVHSDAVGAEAFGDLLLVRHRRWNEDLDRSGLGGPPAVESLERRAPEQNAAEDAALGVDREVVVPRAELAARVDPALAAARRRLVARVHQAAAGRADRLLERPQV